MIEPQFAKPGESPGFGLGFAISKLDNERRIGHGGAIYGFATEVQALPDARLGAIVVATVDCANGFTQHVAETALRVMMRQPQRASPCPRWNRSMSIAREARGRTRRPLHPRAESYRRIAQRNGKLYLSPFNGAMTVELRSLATRSPSTIDSRSAVR